MTRKAIDATPRVLLRCPDMRRGILLSVIAIVLLERARYRPGG